MDFAGSHIDRFGWSNRGRWDCDDSRRIKNTNEEKKVKPHDFLTKTKVMIETRRFIERAKGGARILDDMLVDGRKSAVGRNLMVIEGRHRSDMYVSRLAGHSTDVYRKSVTERAVEFYGATVLESPNMASLVDEFWRPLFEYPAQVAFTAPNFWDTDETLSAVLSQVRQSVAKGDKKTAQFYACQAKAEVEKMLRSLEGIG